MANKIRRSKADVAFTVVDNLLLGLVLIIVLYPLWFILILRFLLTACRVSC